MRVPAHKATFIKTHDACALQFVACVPPFLDLRRFARYVQQKHIRRPVCKTVAARAGRRAEGDAVLDHVGAILDASYIQSAPETLGQLTVT